LYTAERNNLKYETKGGLIQLFVYGDGVLLVNLVSLYKLNTNSLSINLLKPTGNFTYHKV